MIIQSMALRTPSRCLSNDDIIELIREYNHTSSSGEVLRYCEKIKQLLQAAGAQTRYIRDRPRGERGFDLTIDAVRSALAEAGIVKDKLDLIIFCGVGRGFVEPANAVFVAKALGVACDAFDILDACMSWVRAMHVAYNFLANRTYSNALIVNAEFNVYEHGLPDLLKICSDEKIRYTFPALTIGEATTATVVTASERHWNFHFRSAPASAALCSIPLPGYEEFCEPDPRLGLNGPHRLVSFGSELSFRAVRAMVAFLKVMYHDLEPADIWFPHATAEPVLRFIADKLGLSNKMYLDVFAHYGNLVSASIPAGMVLANRDGRLGRGDRMVLCPATAGMAFALVEGEY
jgi:3-oxoacyl-[acyl-carrier-protein] synthase III